MNLLMQLAAVQPKATKKRFTPSVTRLATMRKKREDLWRAVFAYFGGKATTPQIARYRGMSYSSVNTMLERLSLETPPLIKKCGSVPRDRGLPSTLWCWILD